MLAHDYDFLLECQYFLIQDLFVLLEEVLLVLTLLRRPSLENCDQACVLLQALLLDFLVKVCRIPNDLQSSKRMLSNWVGEFGVGALCFLARGESLSKDVDNAIYFSTSSFLRCL